MRRFAKYFAFVLIAALSMSEVAQAGGLYVGHGRRSAEQPWSARLNVSGGFHGAGDPFGADYDEDYYDWYEFGGYGSAGLEIHTGYGNSIEFYGMYRAVDDNDTFRTFPFGETVFSRYDVEAWSAGATLRHYEYHRGGGAYVGFGGGYIQTESFLQEVIDGVEDFRFESDDQGGEVHFLVGFEGRFTPGMMFGVELGYRHAFLDEPDDFSGAVLGLRMGFLLGR